MACTAQTTHTGTVLTLKPHSKDHAWPLFFQQQDYIILLYDKCLVNFHALHITLSVLLQQCSSLG